MKTFIWVTTTVLWLIAAAVSLFISMFVPMLFDAPGSEENRAIQALALAITATPVLFLLAAILPWVFNRKRFAGWLFLLPFLGFLLIVVLAQL